MNMGFWSTQHYLNQIFSYCMLQTLLTFHIFALYSNLYCIHIIRFLSYQTVSVFINSMFIHSTCTVKFYFTVVRFLFFFFKFILLYFFMTQTEKSTSLHAVVWLWKWPIKLDFLIFFYFVNFFFFFAFFKNFFVFVISWILEV